MANSAMPAAQSSIQPARRLIAVGTIPHHGSRTVTVRATLAGVTGTISSRCPVPMVPTQQTFEAGPNVCPVCEFWTGHCPTQQTSSRDLAVAR